MEKKNQSQETSFTVLCLLSEYIFSHRLYQQILFLFDQLFNVLHFKTDNITVHMIENPSKTVKSLPCLVEQLIGCLCVPPETYPVCRRPLSADLPLEPEVRCLIAAFSADKATALITNSPSTKRRLRPPLAPNDWIKTRQTTEVTPLYLRFGITISAIFMSRNVSACLTSGPQGSCPVGFSV